MKIRIVISTLFLVFLNLFCIGQSSEQLAVNGIQVNIKICLQGAMLGVKPPQTLMRDDLRAAGLIPMQEPYSALSNYSHYGERGGLEVIENPAILQVTGPDAIVDWVFVQLRHPEFQKIILATRSALLQRDGDVVEVDGVSPLRFPGVEPGTYLVGVCHRNHLGVLATQPYELAEKPILVDFTDPKANFYGNHPMIQLVDKMALFAGDANRDGEVSVQGAESDRDRIFFSVLLSPDNLDANQNFILKGYSDNDINMDGQTKYQGPNADGSLLSFDIVFFWRYNCPQVDKDCRLVEQMP